MKITDIKKARNVAVGASVVCYFLMAFSVDQSAKAAFWFLIATILFAGAGYFAHNLLYAAKKRKWQRKRAARLKNETLATS